MRADRPTPHRILQENPAFAALPADRLERLAALARTEIYRERTLLSARGEPPQRLWYVAAGAVDLTLSSPDGEIARLPITAGYWATWAGCFGSTPPLFDFWSSKSATLVAFPRAEVVAAVRDNPAALRQIVDFLSENVTTFTAWILSATIFSAERRLAYVLLVLSARNRESATREAVVTREQLGMLGLGTRQRVSRLLNGLAERGLVELREGRVLIPSREKLDGYAF